MPGSVSRWRGRRVVFQLAAQASHVEAQVVGTLLEPRTPHRGQQLRRPDQLAGTIQQELQDLPFGRREPERLLLTGGRPVTAMPACPGGGLRRRRRRHLRWARSARRAVRGRPGQPGQRRGLPESLDRALRLERVTHDSDAARTCSQTAHAPRTAARSAAGSSPVPMKSPERSGARPGQACCDFFRAGADPCAPGCWRCRMIRLRKLVSTGWPHVATGRAMRKHAAS